MIPVDIDKRVLQSCSVSQFYRTEARIMNAYLDKPWFPRIVVHVHHVRFRPESPQASRFERGPPAKEEVKLAIVAPRMQLELQLSDCERRARKQARRLVRRQKCGQRVKLGRVGTLNVDLEHVDESVAWKIRLFRRDNGADRGRLTVQLRIRGAVSAMSA